MNLPAQNTTIVTLAELVWRLGDIPLDRIRYLPRPGSATDMGGAHLMGGGCGGAPLMGGGCGGA